MEDIEKAVRLSMQYGWEAVAKYYELCNELDSFDEAYNGVYDSEEDFAHDLANDIYSEKDLGVLKLYIDWEKFARDLFINDYSSECLDIGVVVFRRL